jgi:hypothetical protein
MEGKVEMAAKRTKLPKEANVGPDEGLRRLNDETDIEGHGLPTTAPPDSLIRRGPNNGGEAVRRFEEDDDVEGHKKR